MSTSPNLNPNIDMVHIALENKPILRKEGSKEREKVLLKEQAGLIVSMAPILLLKGTPLHL